MTQLNLKPGDNIKVKPGILFQLKYGLNRCIDFAE
jgi:hypothetical protein